MSSVADKAKHKIVQWIFNRHMRWRLKELLATDHSVVFLEYPILPRSRYGESMPPHAKLASVLSARNSVYRQTLLEIAEFADKLGLRPLGRVPFIIELEAGRFAIKFPVDLLARPIHPALPESSLLAESL
jgi:hypothetical protein